MTILLAITFIFGVLKLFLEILTISKLYTTNIIRLELPMEILFGMGIRYIPKLIDKLIFYGSLIFQAYHWLFQQAIIY